MKKILITGATGFVGTHLINFLSENKDHELYGTTLTDNANNNKINLEKIDLQDSERVNEYIQRIKPDQIYHLAAFTSPGDSFKNPNAVVLGNIEIQMNLLNSVLNSKLVGVRILTVSSAEVYGLVRDGNLPIGEDIEMRPINPYAVSKIAQDYLGLQYYLAYKMDIVRVRPFNHIGPFQSPSFAIASFSKQIAEIEKGLQEPVISVGNLDSKRDFTDVRDIVRGYAILMDEGKSGDVYNIGSGKSRSTGELLDKLLSFCKIKIEINKDPARLRSIEVQDSYCDFSKLSKLTGWKPELDLNRTLLDTLDYWRSVV